jgi:hypothetical protein
MAAMSAGVVPQQPPTRFAPRSAICTAMEAMYPEVER